MRLLSFFLLVGTIIGGSVALSGGAESFFPGWSLPYSNPTTITGTVEQLQTNTTPVSTRSNLQLDAVGVITITPTSVSTPTPTLPESTPPTPTQGTTSPPTPTRAPRVCGMMYCCQTMNPQTGVSVGTADCHHSCVSNGNSCVESSFPACPSGQRETTGCN